MATRKRASPRRRNSSFRPRSRRVTLTGRTREVIKWFLTVGTCPVGLCGHAEEEDAADGERLHREGRHEELGGERSTRPQMSQRANACFCRACSCCVCTCTAHNTRCRKDKNLHFLQPCLRCCSVNMFVSAHLLHTNKLLPSPSASTIVSLMSNIRREK